MNLALLSLIYFFSMILVAKSLPKDVACIKSVLNHFFAYSGIGVNLTKSKLYVSGKTPQNVKDQLLNVLEIQTTDNIGAYLGFPLHSNSWDSSYDHILDKIKIRSSGWKSKFLNLVGRRVLIKSVLESIPSHYFQCSPIPKGICNKINAISCIFFLGSSVNKKKFILWGGIRLLTLTRGVLGFKKLITEI